MSNKTPVVWTNDDISVGGADAHRRQLAFLNELGIPGVFFIIPEADGKTIDQDVELMHLIEASRDKGHEYYQHGHVHTPYESGIPELWMLAFAPGVMAEYDERRLEIEAGHTFEAMVEMIDKGRRIWRRAFAEDSPGYRPGWGAFCTNMYRALATLGFDWVSARMPCNTSWLWSQLKWDAPIDFRDAVPTRPHVVEGILEMPIAGDYAFHVPNKVERIDAMVGLGMDEFEIYAQRQDPMLIVSHWHGLQRPGADEGAPALESGTGYEVHKKLMPKLLADDRAEFCRMSELAARYLLA